MGKLRAIGLSNLLIALVFSVELSSCELKEVYSWKEVDFEYPSDVIRKEQRKSGAFLPENIKVTDTDVWNGKLFLALPRFKVGVSVTLAYINLNDSSQGKSPKLIPYPDWQTHDYDKNSSDLISVFKITVDTCDRLWVIDTGHNENLTDSDFRGSKFSKTRMLVFDLKTDQLLQEITLHGRADYYGLDVGDIAVDVSKDACDKAFVYVPFERHIVVYDVGRKEQWPYNIHNSPIVFSPEVALSPLDAQGYRTVYFNKPSERSAFAISTKILRDRAEAGKGNPSKVYDKSFFIGYKLDANTGVLLYSDTYLSVHCWNSRKAVPVNGTDLIETGFEESNGVIRSLQLDRDGNVWLVRGRLDHITDPYDSAKPNLMIYKASVPELINGTGCAP